MTFGWLEGRDQPRSKRDSEERNGPLKGGGEERERKKKRERGREGKEISSGESTSPTSLKGCHKRKKGKRERGK